MEVKMEYERNLNHTYLVCRGIQQEKDYQLQMLLNNRIPGLLACKMKKTDGKADLYYEISSKQPLNRLYVKKKMRFQAFQEMFQSLYHILLKMEEFLLPSEILIMKPEMIYVDIEKNKYYFCVIPEAEEKNNSLQELLEFLLNCIDYEDEKAVATAYEWYKKSGEENCSFLSIYKETFEAREYMAIGKPMQEISVNYSSKDEDIQVSATSNVKYDIKNDSREVTEDIPQNWDEADIRQNRGIDKKIIFFIMLIGIGGTVFAVLWKTNTALVIKGIIISGVCITVGLFSYYKKRMNENMKSEELEFDDFLNEEEGEGWTVNNESLRTEKESFDNKTAESEEITYGETVFFKSEQMQEVKKLKPLINEFPEFTLELFPFVLGKLRGAVDGVIEDETVSRIHCKIDYEEGDYYITDLNSTNGTVINEDMLNANEKRHLNSGDEVRIGRAVYTFQ